MYLTKYYAIILNAIFIKQLKLAPSQPDSTLKYYNVDAQQ